MFAEPTPRVRPFSPMVYPLGAVYPPAVTPPQDTPTHTLIELATVVVMEGGSGLLGLAVVGVALVTTKLASATPVSTPDQDDTLISTYRLLPLSSTANAGAAAPRRIANKALKKLLPAVALVSVVQPVGPWVPVVRWYTTSISIMSFCTVPAGSVAVIEPALCPVVAVLALNATAMIYGLATHNHCGAAPALGFLVLLDCRMYGLLRKLSAPSLERVATVRV